MRICFVSHSADLGGAERALLELLDALGSRVEASVVVPEDGPLVRLLRERGVRFSVIEYLWWADRSFTLRQWVYVVRKTLSGAVRIARHLRKHRPDFVVTNTLTIGSAALAAKMAGCRHAWYIHEFGAEDHGLVFALGRRRTFRLINRLGDVCIVVSGALARHLAAFVPREKVRVVYYSATLQDAGDTDPAVPPRGAGSVRCAVVGTLHPGRGQDQAIRAIARLRRSGIEAELWLVGPGLPEHRSYLERLADAEGVGDHVEFLGPVADPQPHIAASDVVLVCTRMGALPRITVEAMRAGKPVIGANAGGTAELIEDGKTGLLYRPGDVDELADRIRYLIEHPERANALGEAGRRWVGERFTAERYADDFLDAIAGTRG